MLPSLFYYCDFCKTLKVNNCRMNPYDPCVANQMLNGSQQSILFHVDNFKLINKYPKLSDSFIRVLCEEYESIVEDGYGEM